MKKRARNICMICGANVVKIKEFCMIWSTLWKRAVPKNKRSGMLCIGCIERKLKRKLSRKDFIHTALRLRLTRASKRLQNRAASPSGYVNIKLLRGPRMTTKRGRSR